MGTTGLTQNQQPAPPKLKGAWPLLGHTAGFVRDTIGLLESARRECGSVAQFRIAGRDMVLLSGPEVHEAFFRASDELLSPSEAYKMMVPIFGKGVAYDNEPKRMLEQLHMLVPALQEKRMQTYGEIIASEVTQSISGWGDEGVIDFYQYTQSLTNFTSSHCLLGREFRLELTDEFARVYRDLERGVIPIAYINPYLPIPAFRRRDQARARLGEMVSQIVEHRRRSGQTAEDFLQTLMEARYSDGTALTDHEITGMLVAAMFAGHRTSAATSAWTLLELLQHSEAFRAVQDEIDRLGNDDQPVTYQSLRDAHETEWVVKEVVRLHPPLFMLLRVLRQDSDFAGYRVPAGTWCIVSPTIAQRDPQLFTDALKFDSKRFSPSRAEDKTPYAYISFGGGRHTCLGSSFALLQIKAIFAMLLRQYEFELYGDPITPDFQGLVVGPKMPCRVRYRRRRTAQD
jgi:sterol 14alpha-demethylase